MAKRVIHRSAKTGKIVTKKYADKHKATTVKEHRTVGKKKAK